MLKFHLKSKLNPIFAAVELDLLIPQNVNAAKLLNACSRSYKVTPPPSSSSTSSPSRTVYKSAILIAGRQSKISITLDQIDLKLSTILRRQTGQAARSPFVLLPATFCNLLGVLLCLLLPRSAINRVAQKENSAFPKYFH